jgi:drug/metabolite transporter (DMT)-like permease
VRTTDWLLLVLLSVLWGGSFFFAAVAVREIPPLTLVLARVALAAALLAPLARLLGLSLPLGLAAWRPYVVLALLNNLVPFSLIVYGQTQIASGLCLRWWWRASSRASRSPPPGSVASCWA